MLACNSHRSIQEESGIAAMNAMGSDTAVVSERRSDRRQRTLKGATLRFNNGFGVAEGVVRNQSENGAQLSFGDATGVPSGFDLAINGAERIRSVRVRWRSPTLVGVQFVD